MIILKKRLLTIKNTSSWHKSLFLPVFSIVCRTFWRPPFSNRDSQLRGPVPFDLASNLFDYQSAESTHEVVARRKWEGSSNPEGQKRVLDTCYDEGPRESRRQTTVTVPPIYEIHPDIGELSFFIHISASFINLGAKQSTRNALQNLGDYSGIIKLSFWLDYSPSRKRQ